MSFDDRDWPAIARIDDHDLRFFFMQDHPEPVMRGLPASFPELFSKGPALFIRPLSSVIKATEQAELELNRGEPEEDIQRSAQKHWGPGCNRLGIPTVVFYQSATFAIVNQHHFFHVMPFDLQNAMAVFKDYEEAAGIFVLVNGLCMVVVDSDDAEKSVCLARVDHINLTL